MGKFVNLSINSANLGGNFVKNSANAEFNGKNLKNSINFARLFFKKALKLSDFQSKTKATNSRGAVAHERNLIAQRFFRSGQSVSLHFALCFCGISAAQCFFKKEPFVNTNLKNSVNSTINLKF